MPPRTVDNLGPDASNRWAQDQEQQAEFSIQAASTIPNQTELDVSSPSFQSESDTLLNSEPTKTTWASFSPPEHFFEQKGQIFSYLIAPRLGTEEKQESLVQKIVAKSQALTDQPTSSKESVNPEPWLEDKEREEKKQETNKLTTLFTTVGSLDKIVIAVNSGRGQYHRG